MSKWVDDVVLAAKQLLRSRRWFAWSALMLGLSLGTATTFGGVLYRVAFESLPVHDPRALVIASLVDPKGQHVFLPLDVARQLGTHDAVFSGGGAYSGGGVFTLEIGGAPRLVQLDGVSPSYYSALGIDAQTGRLLTEADQSYTDSPARVVVISDGLWNAHWRRGAEAIGSFVRVDGIPLQVVGVTRPGFSGLSRDTTPDVQVPIGLLRELGATAGPSVPARAHYVLARLGPGTSRAAAESYFDTRWPAIRDGAAPQTLTEPQRLQYSQTRLRLEPIQLGFSTLRPRYREPLLYLTAAAAVLFMLTGLNLGTAVLARSAARAADLRVSVAIGAPVARLVRQLVLQNLLVAAAGVAVAVPIAVWASRALGRTVWAGNVPLSMALAPDGTVVAFVAAAAMAGALAVSIAPAWFVTRCGARLRITSGRGVVSDRNPVMLGLVCLQVALSFALVSGSLRLTASAYELGSVDPGFSRAGVYWTRLTSLPGAGASTDATYYPNLATSLMAGPGVSAVSFAQSFPASMTTAAASVEVSAIGASESTAQGFVDVVAPRFFETIGVPIRQGRDFDWNDSSSGPAVAIVTRELQTRLFGQDSALGRRLRLGTGARQKTVEVIGVADDARFQGSRKGTEPMVFRPMLQEPLSARIPVLLVKRDDAVLSAQEVDPVVRSFGRHYVTRVTSLSTQVDRAMLRERLSASLAAPLAGLTALVSLVGIYALTSYSFRLRRREMAVRLSLGAGPSSLRALLLKRAVAAAAAGLVVGCPLAVLVDGWTAPLQYGIEWGRPALLVAVGAGLLAAVCVAALAPIRTSPTFTTALFDQGAD